MRRKLTAAILGLLLPTLSLMAGGQWVWYPGQLAAHLQQRMRGESKERCTNVGYPGVFTAPENVLWYKIGRTVEKVETEGNVLPAAFLSEKDAAKVMVSLDGERWSVPETDPQLNDEGVRPDARREVTVPISPRSITPLNSLAEGGDVLKLRRDGKALVDFGEDEMGCIAFKASGSGEVEVFVGESVEEAMNQDSKLTEQFMLAPIEVNGETQVRTIERALRYAMIQSTGEVTIEGLTFETHVWPVERQLTFTSDNEGLNALFEASVKTLHTAMHNFYLDGIKRDYLPWAMDATLGVLGGNYAFGDRQVARNGISVSLMRENPSINDWGIVDYPLYALIAIKADYLRWGDLGTADVFRRRIEEQMALYETQMNEDGFISSNRETRGLQDASGNSGFIPGWGKDMGPETFGTPAYAQMLLYENYRIAAFFERLWKDKDRAEHYDALADKIGRSVVEKFWDPERAAFINGLTKDGERDERISHHAQYIGVITGLYPESEYDRLYDEVIPGIPHYRDNISYEKGLEFFAYQKAGRLGQYLDLLDEVWGGWLREGYCRFPENFRIHGSRAEQLVFYGRPYGLSLCHGANGVPGVVAVLHGIFGFSNDGDATNAYTVRPQLVGMTHAEGRIPTAQGYIELSLQKDGTNSITIPAGCKVTVTGADGSTKTLTKQGRYEF